MNQWRKYQFTVVYTLLVSFLRNHRLLSRRFKEIWKTEGIRGAVRRLRNRVGGYDLYEPVELSEADVEQIQAQIRDFKYSPLISIIMPVHNVAEPWLRKAIYSVVKQYYPHWELCIADDASTRPYIKEIISEYAAGDPRIKFRFLTTHHHISETSNAALAMAGGDYIALLDHDDELSPDALFRVVELLNRRPDADMIYTDEDHIHPSGSLTNPMFKPDWAPDHFLSQMYTCHLGVYRRSLVEQVGGFRKGYEGSQDYDLVLRLMDHKPKIHHIPKLLYHWRMAETSVTANPFNKTYADDAALRAIQDYLDRNSQDAVVEPGKFYLSYRVRYHIRNPLQVGIIIPTRNHADLLRTAIESIRKKTSYYHYTIYVVNNGSDDPKTLDYLERIKASGQAEVIDYPMPFNFSAINNFAVAQTSEPILLFLNNDVEVVNADWLSAMVEHAQRPEIGAVGARLYYPDKTIQHAGIVLGIAGYAGHSHKGLPKAHPGYVGRTMIINNVSAVTGACLMTRREVFDAVGGFDAENLPIAGNDVDFCLKLNRLGYRIVFTPYAELIHSESKSRGYEDTPEKKERFAREVAFFREKWKDILESGDPYYNPNLTLDREDFSIKEGVLAGPS